MLRKLTVWVDVAHMKKLAAIGKRKGLKPSQMLRMAIAEYVERENQ
jgi:predicted transcriptional regulator